MTINNNIPLKAYLRADPHSQVFVVNNNTEVKNLVSLEMFWGNMGHEGIYLDYSLIINRSINVTEGISKNNLTQTLYGEDCDDWINENFINNKNINKLFVIQGYAGCGKTTFINNLIHNSGQDMYSYYINVGNNWSYQQEPYLFFNESLLKFIECMNNIISKTKTRNRIWNKFIEIGSDPDIKELDLELPNIISEFKKIKKNSRWKVLGNNIHQFLYDNYSNKTNKINIWYNVGQVQTIVALLILLICSQFCVEENTNPKYYMLIFDDLDIITNPAIPAENVLSLWGVIHRYIQYKNKKYDNLPNFSICIAVRKVLYSHIISHLPNLEMMTNYNPSCVNVCDISNLYLSQDILKHRIDYWEKNIDDELTKNKLKQLKQIVSINSSDTSNVFNDETENELISAINFDAFFNHNYRAFVNALSAFFEDDKYSTIILSDFKLDSSSKEWQKVATLIFTISYLYRKKAIWNTLGFGCRNFNMIDYPTTLNRLILNYLYMSKCGQILHYYNNNRNDIPFEYDVSLKDIVDKFRFINFLTIDTKLNRRQISNKYNKTINIDSCDLIIERLADMCSRTPKSVNINPYGYDSEDELWRRPLYFVNGVKLKHTAASNIELKAYFKDCLDNNKAEKVKFSITDEGIVLIRDIVANFEFYSARYCRNDIAKPLHQAKNKDEINSIIQPVYNAIVLCCERHYIFMKRYMNKYNIDKNAYLRKYFHPRTRPYFDAQSKVEKKLSKNSFRPQLHIVRVIYNHIKYFNEIKNIFANSQTKNNTEMCKCLTHWIEKYLSLYQINFYKILNSTVCNSDNNVYDNLFKLLEEQNKEYQKSNEPKNIDINNRNYRN